MFINIRSIFFCIVLIILSLSKSHSQNFSPQNAPVVPPSPEASSMGKFCELPVNSYNGTADVKIPIYKIKEGLIDLEINLKYNTSGIKVEEDASWVGLGWSLAASGVITRSIRGLDDFSTYGFYKIPSSQYGCGEGKDTEPDIFDYNFGKYSGKFIIDKPIGQSTGYTIRCASQNNLLIKMINTGGWTVTDADGIVYLFDQTESQEVVYNNYPSGITNTTNQISSWYLSKITGPNGEEIRFEYDTVKPKTEKGYVTYNKYRTLQKTLNNSGGAPISCTQNPPLSTTYSTSTSTVKYENLYLKRIYFTLGAIEFVKDSRSDLKNIETNLPQKLVQIIVSNNNNSIVRKWTFNYTYFSSGSSNPDYLSKRLKLNSVFFQNANSQTIESYSLFYSSLNLPDKNSKDIDYWGYYNGPNNNNSLFFDEANRNPNGEFVKAGILEKIIYPTGGYSKFEFSSNDYSNLDANGDTKIGGGIRIKKISKYDKNDQQSLVEEFEYTKTISGKVVSSGKRMSPERNFFNVKRLEDEWITCAGKSYRVFWDVTYIVKSTGNTLPLGEGGQGNPIGYDLITIHNVDFANNTKHKAILSFNNDEETYTQNYFFPGLPNNIPPLNGYLAKEEVFAIKNNAYSPVKTTIYNYSSINLAQTVAVKFYECFPYTAPTYTFNSSYVTLDSTTENRYDDIDINNAIKKRIEYTYNSQYTSLQSSKLLENNNQWTTIYSYPFDMIASEDPDGVYQNMLSKNQISSIIKTTESKNGTQLKLIKTNYQLDPAGFAKPTSVEVKKSTNVSEIVTRFRQYDDKGNILSISKEDGSKTSYIWGYNKQFPVAKIENANSAEQTIINITSAATISIPKGSLTQNYTLNFTVGRSGNGTITLSFSGSPNSSETAKVLCHVTGSNGYVQDFDLCLGTASGGCSSMPYTLPMNNLQAGNYTLTATMYFQSNLNNGRTVTINYPAIQTSEITASESFYENFESSGTQGNAHTGKGFNNGSYTVNWIRPNARKYVLSYWFRNANVWTYSGEISYTSDSYVLTGGDAYDDVRIHPVDAHMTTYTYEPLVGMTSIIDSKGQTTYYEYDSFQRLILIKDQLGNIVKQFQYNYAQ